MASTKKVPKPKRTIAVNDLPAGPEADTVTGGTYTNTGYTLPSRTVTLKGGAQQTDYTSTPK